VAPTFILQSRVRRTHQRLPSNLLIETDARSAQTCASALSPASRPISASDDPIS